MREELFVYFELRCIPPVSITKIDAIPETVYKMLRARVERFRGLPPSESMGRSTVSLSTIIYEGSINVRIVIKIVAFPLLRAIVRRLVSKCTRFCTFT